MKYILTLVLTVLCACATQAQTTLQIDDGTGKKSTQRTRTLSGLVTNYWPNAGGKHVTLVDQNSTSQTYNAGDLLYALTNGNYLTRLPISSDGSVLSISSGVPAWIPIAPSGNSWPYKAKTTTTSGYPGDGYILWDNATQISAGHILVAHINDANDDIDIFLSYTVTGNKIVLQDPAVSSDNQIWQVSGTPTNFNAGTSTSYWSIPVTFVSSGGVGTTNFSNNQKILFARFAIATAAPHSVLYDPPNASTQVIQAVNNTTDPFGIKQFTGSTHNLLNITASGGGNLLNVDYQGDLQINSVSTTGVPLQVNASGSAIDIFNAFYGVTEVFDIPAGANPVTARYGLEISGVGSQLKIDAVQTVPGISVTMNGGGTSDFIDLISSSGHDRGSWLYDGTLQVTGSGAILQRWQYDNGSSISQKASMDNTGLFTTANITISSFGTAGIVTNDASGNLSTGDGSANFILNQTALQTSASFNIDGTGKKTANGIATTVTPGFVLTNTTASTALVPNQESPSLNLISHGWNAGDITNTWNIYSGGGANTPSNRENLVFELNQGSGAQGDFRIFYDGLVSARVGYRINSSAPTAGHFLRGDGSAFVDGTIQASDLPSMSSTDAVVTDPANSSKNLIKPTADATALRLQNFDNSSTSYLLTGENDNGSGITTTFTLDKTGAISAHGLDMNSNRINNVTDPSSAQDAATKNYVDAHTSLWVSYPVNTINTTAAGSDGSFTTASNGKHFVPMLFQFHTVTVSGAGAAGQLSIGITAPNYTDYLGASTVASSTNSDRTYSEIGAGDINSIAAGTTVTVHRATLSTFVTCDVKGTVFGVEY